MEKANPESRITKRVGAQMTPIPSVEEAIRDRRAQANDVVNHPSHYVSHPSGVECITITEHINFNIGNAVKYLWRADQKNGLEDLKKAAWYVKREIERLERK